MSLLEPIESFAMPGILSQIFGNTKVMPKKTNIPPDIYVQTSCGNMINTVETLRRYVKSIIEIANDVTTIYGVALLLPDAEDPITTGSNGKMHGANTVRIPAINDRVRNVMNSLNLVYK